MTEYRTRNKAGSVAEIPDKLAIITNKEYQNAMNYSNDMNAHLQVITSADELECTDGKLYFQGVPVSNATIKHLYTDNNIEEFNLTLLKSFYSIILKKYNDSIRSDGVIDEVITIYYPDFARKSGRKTSVSRRDVINTIHDIQSFRNIVGITEKNSNILPVLVYMGEDVEKNTISFASPYIFKIVQDIYKVSARKDKNNNIIIGEDGTYKMKASYSYLADFSLAREHNTKAVEIVLVIVKLIEQVGDRGVPHISARTIIDRNPLLKRSIENSKNISNKNKFLFRAFDKAWKLLREKTDLMKKYKNIELPDPQEENYKKKYIPTMSNLDIVFTFRHEGKNKEIKNKSNYC